MQMLKKPIRKKLYEGGEAAEIINHRIMNLRGQNSIKGPGDEDLNLSGIQIDKTTQFKIFIAGKLKLFECCFKGKGRSKLRETDSIIKYGFNKLDEELDLINILIAIRQLVKDFKSMSDEVKSNKVVLSGDMKELRMKIRELQDLDPWEDDKGQLPNKKMKKGGGKNIQERFKLSSEIGSGLENLDSDSLDVS